VKKKAIVAVSLVLALAAGCKSEVEKTPAPVAPQAVSPEPAVGKQQGGINGKVAETMDASGYTYVLVDKGTEKVWVAGPRTVVKVGDEVFVPEGTPMANFESKTLKRTFEQIIFAPSLMVGGEAGKAGMPAAQMPADHAAKATPPAAVDLKGITKAKGGKNVSEVFAERKTLNGKNVLVRGKVVKFMSGIMGKNWLHVKDGTGAAGTDDLVVTTNVAVKVGDKVLVNGKVAADKDFGSGYRYDVIVEDAEVTVE